MADLLRHAASIGQLRSLCAKRLPRFVWEYLEGGCGDDRCKRANREALDAVQLLPHSLSPCDTPQLHTTLFGDDYTAPFGVAPLGLSGLIWPDASIAQARAAAAQGLPFVLSTMSTNSLEDIADSASTAPWFQLYLPADTRIRDGLLQRAWAVGVRNLVVTIDVPAPGRRPNDLRNGLGIPPRIDARNVLQSALRPLWSMATLRKGIPQFANIAPYLDAKNLSQSADQIRFALRRPTDRIALQELRELWKGQLIVKGILNTSDAQIAQEIGAEGLIVSNHGGRQLDAAPTAIAVLPDIVKAVGAHCTVMADGGITSGTDIARMLALGARSVFAGRACLYGVGALGAPGAAHALQLLHEELQQVLVQLRCAKVSDLPSHLHKSDSMAL